MVDFLVFFVWPLTWGIIGFAMGWVEGAHHAAFRHALRSAGLTSYNVILDILSNLRHPTRMDS